MDKKVLAAASSQYQKYFFESEFAEIPDSVKDEIKVLCVLTAEKLGCTFVIGYEDGGDIYFEIVRNSEDFDFDEIGAELEIKKIKSEQGELLKALKLWYLIYKTDEGGIVRNQLSEDF